MSTLLTRTASGVLRTVSGSPRPSAPAPLVPPPGPADVACIARDASGDWPDPRCLSMPHAIAAGSGWLVAGDTANARLGWRDWPGSCAAAVALIGQERSGVEGDDRWRAPVRDGQSGPCGLQLSGVRARVCEAGTHRSSPWCLAEAP